MPLDPRKNFAKGTVSTGYDASATEIVLTTGHGARFPAASFNATWWNATDYPDPSEDPNVEIVRVTAIDGDTLTITRAQEGTSASTKNAGGKVYRLVAGVTKKTLDDLEADLAIAGGGGGGADQRDLFNFGVCEIYEDWLSSFSGIGVFQTGVTNGAARTWGPASAPGCRHGLEFRTGASANALGWAAMAGGANASVVPMDGSEPFDMRLVYYPGNSITAYRFRFGLAYTSRVIDPDDGVYIRYDVSDGDTTWRAVARSSSTNTLGTDSLGAPSPLTKAVLRIWSAGDGAVRFSVNDGTEVVLSSGLPSGSGHPFFVLGNAAETDQRGSAEAFAMRHLL